MLIYLILLIYVFFVSILYCYYRYKLKKDTSKMKKLYLLSVFLPLFIVMGFRGRFVGTDTYSYTIYFKQICNWSFEEALDFFPLGWVILNKCIYLLFGMNPSNYIICVSFLILFLIAKFIYDFSENVAISTILFILFYHYFSAFNGMRQYLAIAISINSFKFLLESKNLKFLVINLIAVSIHPTSLIFLILLFTNFIKQNFNSFFKFSILILMGVLLINPIVQIFVNFFPHYQLYLDDGGIGTYGFGQGQNRSFIITIIYVVFELFMLLRFYKNSNNFSRIEFMFIFINFVGILFLFLSLTNTLFNRLAWYFILFAIIYIPHCFNCFSKKNSFYLNIIFIVIMIIPYYIQLSDNINGILPFSWY